MTEDSNNITTNTIITGTHKEFLPNQFGSLFFELLRNPRLAPLDSGKPNVAFKSKLKNISIKEAFAAFQVVDTEMAKCCLAGILLYHNYLDESHKICQTIQTESGSYWHALMHRREPDYFNSKYWFNRVGDHPVFADLKRAAAKLAENVNALTNIEFLTKQTKWDPFDFIDLCDSTLNSGRPCELLCRQIQLVEWQLLFKYCFEHAVGIAL